LALAAIVFLTSCFFDLPEVKPDADAGSVSPPSPTDAGAEAAADAGGGGDASAGDAGDAGDDATATSLCTGHLFCDDFDTGALGAKWESGPDTQGVGTIDLDLTQAVSKPRGIRTRIPAGNDTSRAYLTQRIPLDDRGVRVEVSVGIEAGGTTENYAIISVVFEPSGGNQTANVFVDHASTKLGLQRPAFQSVSGTKIPTGGWHRIRFDAIQKTTGGSAVVSLIDGGTVTELVRADNLAYDVQDAGTRKARLELGVARYNLPTTAIDVRYDDLTFDQLP
jgi:hypothetical protein